MPPALGSALSTGTTFWSGLRRSQQVLLAALALGLPLVLFFGSRYVSHEQYVPLFASLPPEDAGVIVNQLKAAKTPYRVAGDQILVPAEQVSEIRLRVAGQGLPLGGGVGFEVFDKTSFGTNDFTQRLNYQRALQGELARTIGQLREVSRVRVHLALPQPSLFTERDRPPSASVFLKLAPGGRLSAEQVRGIVHLVSSSVEGLGPERVTVVDTAGRVLSVGAEGGAGAAQLSPRRLEAKGAVEESLEKRVQSLLELALGPGQAITRVSAQMNFDQVDKTEERFDPNSVVRQETRSVESSKGNATSPVGVASINPPAAPLNSVNATEGNRESETVNYEISRIVARTLTAPGEIQRLTVAVVLNAKPTAVANADKAAADKAAAADTRQSAAEKTATPRSAEELEKIRTVVMGAVGYNKARGDEVTVVEMPFDTSALERERELLDGPSPPVTVVNTTYAIGGGAALVVLLVIVAVLMLKRSGGRRRALAQAALSIEHVPSGAGPAAAARQYVINDAPPTLTEPLGQNAEEFLKLGRERKDLRQRAMTVATNEPDATAQLLRAWMSRKNRLVGAQDGK